MKQISMKDNLPDALMQVHLLMCDTLEDLGYTAGIRVFREMVARRKQGDDHD
jgi:hypothetical protein